MFDFQKKKIDFESKKVIKNDQNDKSNDVNKAEIKRKKQQIQTATTVLLNETIFEAMAQFIDTINELNLKSIDLDVPLSGNALVIDKLPAVLPVIYELLKNPYLRKFHLVILKFIYWSLLHCDVNQVISIISRGRTNRIEEKILDVFDVYFQRRSILQSFIVTLARNFTSHILYRQALSNQTMRMIMTMNVTNSMINT